MSGICGFLGRRSDAEDLIRAMLDAINYRGDAIDIAVTPEASLGYRWWKGRPGKAPGIYRGEERLVACSGTLAPSSSNPAAALHEYLSQGAVDRVDGAFAYASWDGRERTLTLARDPFGIRSLYYVAHDGDLYFASELKQILAIPGLAIELDHVAIHKYLTFSFFPGEDVPIRGIRRVLPGHIAIAKEGASTFSATQYVTLKEQIDPALAKRKVAVEFIREHCRRAVSDRLSGEDRVGLFLSGGLDSSGVGVWLKEAGVQVEAFSLDFGAYSVEKPQAQAVAEHLDIPLTFVPVDGGDVAEVFSDLIWRMDLPFGDPVTGPQFLLGRTAHQAGLAAIFNGEGGDQLFGGWTNKPMIAASLYANLYGDDSWEELYLKSYHRFYGREADLYTPELQAKVGGPGQRRALLKPYLSGHAATSFFGRMRFADIALKGSQNILPRMERMANAWGLDARVPLFDRRLAEAAFTLPPRMKLNGAVEKYVLKHCLKKSLPSEVVWQRKFGMSVPITDWALALLPLSLPNFLATVRYPNVVCFDKNTSRRYSGGSPKLVKFDVVGSANASGPLPCWKPGSGFLWTEEAPNPPRRRSGHEMHSLR